MKREMSLFVTEKRGMNKSRKERKMRKKERRTERNNWSKRKRGRMPIKENPVA